MPSGVVFLMFVMSLKERGGCGLVVMGTSKVRSLVKEGNGRYGE